MSVLQDQCPHKPFPIIRQIIQEEYNNTPMEDIFESFDPTPIGSASIGQVHRATLRPKYCNGKNRNRNVVVKVQYPEVERVFRGDVRTIKMFAQVAQPGRFSTSTCSCHSVFSCGCDCSYVLHFLSVRYSCFKKDKE